MNHIKLARITLETILDLFDETLDSQYDGYTEVKEAFYELLNTFEMTGRGEQEGETVPFFDINEDGKVNTDSDRYRACKLLAETHTYCNGDFKDFDLWEILDQVDKLDSKLGVEDDFSFDLPCGEVRIIDKDAIDQIWTDSLIEQIKDCYDLSDIPDFIAIDWEATAEACKADGMAHHFSGYDGSERETDTHHIFRTN